MFKSGNVLPVQIQPPLLRPLAYRVLSKKYGLNIKSDGLAVLAEAIGTAFGMEWKRSTETLKFLEQFAFVWKQQERGLFIDRNGASAVIAELKEREKAYISMDNSHTKATGKTSNIDTLLGKANDNLPSTDDSPPRNSSLSPGPIEEDLADNPPANLAETELDWRDYFKVINASEQQRFSYDPAKFQFVLDISQLDGHKLNLPTIHSKNTLFQTRYFLLRDKVMRNEAFQNEDQFNPLSSMVAMQQQLLENTGGPSNASPSATITAIKNLLGRNGQNFLLLGLLRQNISGRWSLEDPSGSVEIDISQCVPTQGLHYVPGCIVLAEGLYYTVGNRFHVLSITHPPGERRETTLDAIGNIDFLGIHGQSSSNFIAKLDTELKIRLHFLEKDLFDHRITVLGGDIFLDEPQTLSALKKVLEKLDEDPPVALVFQGSFSSVPVHPSFSSKAVPSSTRYKNSFDNLASLLSDFQNIVQNTKLIFVPGVNDPWSSTVTLGSSTTWPQPPIPAHFRNRIDRVCKNIKWASNPCRIAYLAQEIVICRDDIRDRLRRHGVKFPTATRHEVLEQGRVEDMPEIDKLTIEGDSTPNRMQASRKLVKTILDQGHLSPFDVSIRPLFWDLDHVLTLYPIPSTMVLCDLSSSQFDLTYNGCKVFNPGKFTMRRRARYMDYIMSERKVSQEEVYF